MIFDSVTNGSPAPESCRKENAMVGIVQPNGNGNIGKFVRRRRMELCRVKEKCAGQQGIISGKDIYTKKRRSAGVTCRSHGSISVIGRRREMEDAVTLELRFLKKGLKSYDFFWGLRRPWRVSGGACLPRDVTRVAVGDCASGRR